MGSHVPQPELCIVFGASGAGDDDARRLAAALDAVAASCVIVAGGDGHSAPSAGVAQPLVALAQARGIAALIWQDAGVARTIKADGVHLPWSRTLVADLGTAREILDSRAIVGADAGRSRHEAMALGEAGASYVGFGAPPDLNDRAAAVERRTELLSWWAEIFEVPCVAFDVDDAEAAAELAAAGADFLAMTVAEDTDLDRLRAVSSVLAGREGDA